MKNTIGALLIACATLSLSAQAPAERKWQIGANIGPNYNFFYGSPSLDNGGTPTVYFTGGISAEYGLGKVLSLASGLYFNKEGKRADQLWDYSNPKAPLVFHYKSSYNYLSIPLMLKASFGKNVRFFVNAGGYFSYLTSASSKAYFSNNKNTMQKSTFTEVYMPFDFGVSSGIGFSAPISSRLSIAVECRNYTGLMDIGDETTIRPIKTNSTNVMLGVTFKL